MKLGRKAKESARIAFDDEAGKWYALDNAAIIMPAVTRGMNTYVFRLLATIDEPVNLSALQLALDHVLVRFEYFRVRLSRGLFWHYLVPFEGPVRVEAEPESGLDFSMQEKGACLFRVRASGRRITCDFSHVLTDGTGGLRFLKNLLVEYFRIRGHEADTSGDPDIYDLSVGPSAGEVEDAYHRYFPGRYPHPPAEKPAWRLSPTLLPFGQYRVTTGTLPFAELHAAAKAHGATLTEFLTAVYFDALQELWFAEGPRRGKRWRLAIEVPVNMRKFFDTASNRNFSLFAHPEQDMRLGRRDLETIVERTHYQLRLEFDRPSLARQIARNVGGQRQFFVRAMPLFLKVPFMRVLFSMFGVNKISGGISNLGPVAFPPALAHKVERFYCIPSPSSSIYSGATVVSWNGMVHVTFGSIACSSELERLYFTRLRKLGIPVKISCNTKE